MEITLSYFENEKEHTFKGKSKEVVHSFSSKGCRIWNGKVTSVLGEKFFIKYIMSEYSTESFCSQAYYSAAKQRFEKESQCRFRYPFLTYVHRMTKAVVTDEEGHRFEVLCLMEEDNGSTTFADFYHEETEENKNKKVVFGHMLQLLYGLEYYSDCKKPDRIIHRDLKPSNIMLVDGCVKYIDFDWCHVDNAMETRLEGDPIFGTEEFAHPKQMVENQDSSFVGMDMYSLGLIFIYMMCHIVYKVKLRESKMWQNAGEKEQKRILHHLYRSIIGSEIDDELASVIAKMIADEKKQYKSVRDIIIDFEEYLKKQKMYDEIMEEMYKKYHLLPRKSREEDRNYIISVSVYENSQSEERMIKERLIYKIHAGETKCFRDLGKGNSIRVFCAGNEIYHIIEQDKDKNIKWDLSGNEVDKYGQIYSGNNMFEFELLNMGVGIL